jgi:CRP/FNR family transcriptional regulator
MGAKPGHPHGCDVCAIREGWLFSRLEEEEVDKLIGLAHPLPFARRQILFGGGTEATEMFLITRGVVKLTRVTPDGRAQVVRLVYPGHIAGSEGFFHERHDVTAEALASGGACVLPRNRLMRTLRTCPEFALHLLQAMHEELEQARQQIQEMGRTSAESKICALLCDLFPHMSDEREESVLPLAHQDLADILGLTRETISRVVSDMAKRRVFSLSRKRVQVHDFARLRELAR